MVTTRTGVLGMKNDRFNDAALLRMLERDTIALAMSPGARANRAKQTGNRKLSLTVATECCNYKGGELAFVRQEREDGTTYSVPFKTGDTCGDAAVITKKVNGRTERRCSAHMGLR